MRIGALIKSYHNTQYLPLILKQYAWVDKIVVMNYRFLNVEPIYDNTYQICEYFIHENLVCKSGSGVEQHNIYNNGIDLLQDCDVAFIADSDEFLLKSDQEKVIKFLHNRLDILASHDFFTCNIVDYKYNLCNALPQREGLSIFMVVPKRTRFHHIRSVDHKMREYKITDITMHHLGLVFPKEILKWKLNWEHKEEEKPCENILTDWQKSRYVSPPYELVEFIGKSDAERNWVYAGGVFDLLHYGHIRFLERAKRLGDILVVGITTDNSVADYKGKRPILTIEERASVIRNLGFVDYVVRQEQDPTNTLKFLKDELGWTFKYMVRGGDFNNTPPEKGFIEENGGKVIKLPYYNKISSSEIKKRMGL